MPSVLSLGQFEPTFNVGDRRFAVSRRIPLAGLGQTSARDRLTETIAAIAGEENAEQAVSDLEVVVASAASRASERATSKIIKRGLLISAAMSVATVTLTWMASR